MTTYEIKGIKVYKNDCVQRFSMTTTAVSEKKAISNIKFRIMKESGKCLIRDLSIEILKELPTNVVQLSLF